MAESKVVVEISEFEKAQFRLSEVRIIKRWLHHAITRFEEAENEILLSIKDMEGEKEKEAE